MKKSNHTVGECYKTLNIHDPHEQYAWEGKRPWWVRPLQVLGFVTTAAGVALFFWSVVTLMLILEG